MVEKFTIEKSKVWVYSMEKGSWYFVTIPPETTELINGFFGHEKRAWGSLPVKVTLGSNSWKTSIFPDSKSKSFLLPLKADIRKKENISENDEITFGLEILN